MKDAGYKGPLCSEIKAASFDAELDVPIVGAIYGLGGRDITVEDFSGHIEKLAGLAKTGEIEHEPAYIGLRE